MSELKMGQGDYATLAKLEDSFQEKNLSHFISLLASSKNLPLLLRVHAVCMLEHIGDESVVPSLCGVLKDDPSPLTRHEAAFTLGQLGTEAQFQHSSKPCSRMRVRSFYMNQRWLSAP